MEMKRLQRSRLTQLLATAALMLASTGHAQDDQEAEPFLRVKPGGPQSYVTALAFSPSGKTLYAAGWDKVIHVWEQDGATGRYTPRTDSTLRIPVGPGLRGAINAMALSTDGRWLAVAGHGIIRGGATFRRAGRVVPSEGVLTPEMRLDEGVIYVFDTRDRSVRVLRGHYGAVVALSFAPGAAESPVLVSAAREWTINESPGRFLGAVRVWDVLRREQANGHLAGRYLPEPKRRPGLAVTRLGRELKALQLGIAWGDDQFRVWDVATNQLRQVDCGRYCNTVTAVDGGYLTSAYERGGRLEFRGPAEVSDFESLGSAAGQYIPRALSASASDRQIQLAVVSRVLNQGRTDNNRFTLQLATAQSGDVQPVRGQAELWPVPNTGALPTLAVSNAAKLVAVAGDSDQSVWLFRMGLRNGAEPVQKLQNVGRSWREVGFVSRNGEQGLRLANANGPIVFKLAGDVAITSSDGWEPVSARRGEWQLTAGGNLPPGVVQIQKSGRLASQINLPKGDVLSTAAFGKLGTGEDAPTLVAVASHNLGQATLRLYDAESGVPCRQLTAHTQTIQRIAFSSDGKLLATVANDQMVCLWSLSDLASVLGTRGALPGVAVRWDDNAQGVSITAIQTAASETVRNTLQVGDVLTAFEANGKVYRWRTGREFLDVFWSLRPGTQGTLSFQSGNASRELAVAVGQGIDERKPLFSLFIADGQERDEQEWIAWTPIGPYEASGREAERLLGWHFNTGQNDSPVRFAAASEYRETYHHPGLVQQLVEHGEMRRAAPPPPPAVSIRFGPEAQQMRGANRDHVIRMAPQNVMVYLSDFPYDLIDTVEVRLQAQEPVLAGRRAEDTWSADLGSVDWTRGERQIQATIHTNESPPRKFVRQILARRIPLPPELSELPPRNQVVEAARFEVNFLAQTSLDEGTRLRLLHNGNPTSLAADQRSHVVDLQPGDNQFELIATNANAAADTLGMETARRRFAVTFKKAQALPPTIKLLRLETNTADPKSVEIRPDGSTISDEPLVRVLGQVSSEGPLSYFNLEVGDQTSQIEADEDGSFAQEVALAAGDQRVRLLAQTEDSDEAVASFSVRYVPQLPRVTLQADQSGVIHQNAGDTPAVVNLTGTLDRGGSAEPFEARVLLNGVPVEPPQIDLGAGTWSARVPLKGGENRIRLTLHNEWGNQATSEAVVVEYLRTPVISEVQHSDVGREPFTNVTAVVVCPQERPLTGVSLNGKPLASSNWQQTDEREGLSYWEVDAKRVALRPGENVLVLNASNDDGPCQVPVERRISYDAEMWAPPSIVFQNAEPAMSVTESDFELQFRVESASPIGEVRVTVDGQFLTDNRVQIETTPDHDATARAELTLRRGVNQVAVQVKNEGGERWQRCEISYVPPPVRVVITSLEPIAGTTDAIRPVVREDNMLTFTEPIESGLARLRGVAQWQGELPPGAAAPEIRVWVNDFQQRPVQLDRDRGEQEFEAVVIFGKEKANRVHVDLHGAPNDSDSRLSFFVDCSNPRAGQRLHLLTIGIDEDNARSLKERALTAVQALRGDDGQFVEPYRSTVFDRIHAHPVLSGRVTFSDVFRMLLDVRSDLLVPTLDKAGKPMPINDVVMLYYEGGILVPQQEHFVLSTSQKFDPSRRYSAISSEWLAKFFDSMRGAQLAFIDVASRQTTVPVGDWKHDSHAALLCYAWANGTVPPAELRLISHLREALVASGRLDEVDQILDDISGQSADLTYHRSLPDRLKTLILK